MEGICWLAQHGLDVAQTLGIVGGLVFTAYSVRKDDKARRIGNLIAINQQYRDIWKELYYRPELSRVLEKQADLAKKPISDQEGLFVNLLILHLECVYRAMKEGVFMAVDGLQEDIRGFFSSSIAKAIWEKSKPFRSKDFVKFVEMCRRGGAATLKLITFVLGLAEKDRGLVAA